MGLSSGQSPYFKMTFDMGASETNHDRALNNLTGCYLNAATTAQRIADHVGKITW
jgi:hypothetical protein